MSDDRTGETIENKSETKDNESQSSTILEETESEVSDNASINSESSGEIEELENQNEFYTIDRYNEILIYGGSSHEIFVNNMETNTMINTFDDFTDSVAYLKFIDSENFYAVSLVGEVGIYNIKDGLKDTTNLEEEITSFSYNSGHLVLGSVNGTVYKFYEGIKFLCFYGNTTEIYQAEFLDEQIYTLSGEKFSVYDAETCENLYTMNSYLLTCFHLVSSSVYLIASEKNLRIYKNDRLLKKIDTLFHTFLETDNGVLCGGEKLIEVGFKNSISVFDFEVENKKILDMKRDGNKLVINAGKSIGVGDIRKGVEWIDLELGEIFDFCLSDEKIILVGESGLTVLEQ